MQQQLAPIMLLDKGYLAFAAVQQHFALLADHFGKRHIQIVSAGSNPSLDDGVLIVEA